MKLPFKKDKKESFYNFLFGIKIEIYTWICQDIKRKSQRLFQKEKKYCIYDEQEQRIKAKVEERREKANKFDRVKEVAPIIKKEIEHKRNLEDVLFKTKDIIWTLYLAYCLKNEEKVKECFERLKEIGILDNKQIKNE